MPAPYEPNARGSARVRSGNTPGRDGMSRGTVPRSYLKSDERPGSGRVSGSARVGGGGGGGQGPGGGRGVAYKGKRRPRWGRIALVVLIVLVLLGGAGALGIWAYANSLDSNLKRTDAFAGLTGGRPAKTVDGALNILMLGSDSRDPKTNTGWRPDTIMLLHIDADHNHAYSISIPRDTYVYIPAMKGADNGDTHDKINAAFAWGGAPLMVKTVEGFTGVRIDHVAIMNFAGFASVTDALGGVDMYVDQTITSIHPPYRKFTQGMHHFTGAEALDYCRQRYQFADGDFTREKHQQAFLKALMSKAASSGTLSDPVKLNDFLQAVTKVIVVDKDFQLVDMALQFRNLRAKDVTFLTSPHDGTPTINGESVVESDKAKASALYEAVNNDKIADWVKQNPGVN
jgi:LCP family protein required for cell wall assembly